jgi:bidirectional [NiFe] hydrogenase diaphorase subunit
MPVTDDVAPTPKIADNRLKLLERAMSRHHYSGSALIEVLHTAQELFGYLSPELLSTIARKLRLPPSRVLGVASFYHFFALEPAAAHSFVVCLGTACYVAGALGLVETLTHRCGGKGEDKTGGEVSVRTARCIGTCGVAPAVIHDGEILAKVTPETLHRKLDSLGVAQAGEK